VRELTLPRSGGITAAVLGAMGAGDPHRPRLVWHGQGRTELSTASLTNWAAKTAGYLVDELGAGPGDRVLWRVRRSWQGLPLLLGCWWAGLLVTDDEAIAGDVVVAFVDQGDQSVVDSGVDPVFDFAGEVVVASTHPFGLAVADLPPLYRSVADAIRPQADRFAPRGPGPGPDAPAILTATGSLTVGEVLAVVGSAAAALPEGAVLLSAAAPDLPDGVCGGALAAWAAGGCLVQLDSDSTDPDRVAADERAIATLGFGLGGLPRVG
jgi:uncharacterized protein (TIGR03089 family)